MIKITIQLSEGIRRLIKDKPSDFIVESPVPVTIKQLARDVGIPSILVAFAIANGEKKNLDDTVNRDSQIQFFGTMAGG
ncbi:MAG: hypothetical protein P8010_01625 [Desulfosarcinaceae bacterium]|jgi:hypothetical protein